MGRKKRTGSDTEIRKQRKREKELISLIEKPKDRTVPTVPKEIETQWKSMIDVRLETLQKHREVVDRIEKTVKEMEATDDTDLRVYIATLSELRRSLDSLSKSIDDSIPTFYDPKEQVIDNQIEIIVRYDK